MEMKEKIVVKAVLAFPYLHREDDNGKYSLQLCNLSQSAAAKLEEMGVPVKQKDEDKFERGYYIQATSKFPFKPVDEDGLPLDASTIGYGSVVRASVTTYDWTYRNKSGTSPRILHLVIDELVEPEDAVDLDDFEEAL